MQNLILKLLSQTTISHEFPSRCAQNMIPNENLFGNGGIIVRRTISVQSLAAMLITYATWQKVIHKLAGTINHTSSQLLLVELRQHHYAKISQQQL